MELPQWIIRFFLVTFVLVLSRKPVLSFAIVKGTIKNQSQSEIYLLEPIGGFCNPLVVDEKFKIKIDPSGTFEKQIEITRPVMLTIKSSLHHPIYLVVSPTDNITVSVDYGKMDNTGFKDGLKIFGPNFQGNMFLNSFYFSGSERFARFNELLNHKNFFKTKNIKIIDTVFKLMLKGFDSLLSMSAIEREFYDISVADIKGSLISNLCRKYQCNASKIQK